MLDGSEIDSNLRFGGTGFSEEHDTWENADDIDSDKGPQILDEGDEDLDLEVDFYRQHPDAAKWTDPPAAHKQPTR
jgi:hypothetical protein